jgi:hypothetical protein
MKQMLSIVPDSFLEKLNAKQDQIIDLLKSTDKLSQNEFLTEKEARVCDLCGTFGHKKA